jgi:hypothetical protein
MAHLLPAKTFVVYFFARQKVFIQVLTLGSKKLATPGLDYSKERNLFFLCSNANVIFLLPGEKSSTSAIIPEPS